MVYAILKLSKTFPQEPVVFSTENKALAEEAASMLAELGAIVDIRRDLHRLRADTEVYTVSIEPKIPGRSSETTTIWGGARWTGGFLEQDCCRVAFSAGAVSRLWVDGQPREGVPPGDQRP